MRKTIVITLLVLCGTFTVQAQRWDEWFNQKSTQKKYLLEQIAALKVYADYLNKGYNIVKDGAGLIGDIRKGDFNLHNDYFGSLKNVSASVKAQDKISFILSMQQAMLDIRQRTLSEARQSNLFNTEEITDLKKLLADLGAEAGKDLDELSLILTSGQLEMTDDERIRRVDLLYSRVQEKYSTQKKLYHGIQGVSSARKRGLIDVINLKALY